MDIVPALGVLFPVLTLAVVLGFVALIRYMKHREHMAMIQQGIAPAEATRDMPAGRREAKQGRLYGGLVTTFVGVAITVGLLTIGIGPWLLGGLVPLFVGLATLLAYFLGIEERPAGPAGSPPGAGDRGGTGTQG